MGKSHPCPVEEWVEVEVNMPNKMVTIESMYLREQVTALSKLHRISDELFAWSPSDMPSIVPSVIIHELNIDPLVKPIAQRKKPWVKRRNGLSGPRWEN